MTTLRVAVIGAGAAGLAVARALLYAPSAMSSTLHSFSSSPATTTPAPAPAPLANFDVTVFEQSNQVGGTWVFSSSSSSSPSDTSSPHSSMYQSLHTNLPVELMAFPGFPFSDRDLAACTFAAPFTSYDQPPSFVHHSVVNAYLNRFADAYSLRDVIRFNTKVTSVRREHTRWEINFSSSASSSASSSSSSSSSASTFDAVVVCNGHFTQPHTPQVPGLAEHFRGHVSHSHVYREPGPFAGQRVLVVGSGTSAMDIAAELADVTEVVALSAKKGKVVACRKGVVLVPELTAFAEDGSAVFEPVESPAALPLHTAPVCAPPTLEYDAIIFCTGYRYICPFIKDLDVEDAENNILQPIYRNVFHAHHPSLAFVGLPAKCIPFPLFYLQAQWIRSVWDQPSPSSSSSSSCVSLPSTSDMLEDVKRAREECITVRHWPLRYLHILERYQWDYYDMLADAAQVPRLPTKLMHRVYNAVVAVRRSRPDDYRHIRVVFVKGGDSSGGGGEEFELADVITGEKVELDSEERALAKSEAE